MGIFDMFTPKTEQPTQQPTQQQTATTPGNIPNQQTPSTLENETTAGNGIVPSGNSQGNDDSPLANFKDLWDPSEAKEGSGEPPRELTAEDLSKAVSGADFANTVTPEMFASISEGGEGAQKAFVDALNNVARQVMIQSTLVNNKLSEKKVREALEAQKKEIPNLLKKQAVADNSRDSNPIFDNPAVKPVMESIQTALLNKYPTSSPTEINNMAKEYIIAMGQQFAPKPVNSTTDGENWEDYFKAP